MHKTRQRQEFVSGCLVAFAILDAVLLGSYLKHISLPQYWQGPYVRLALLQLARSAFLVSLVFSAYGLARCRQWGLILSYVQFPVRFAFIYLSFGFLTLMPGLPSGIQGQRPVLVVAMGLECLRLVCTIVIHVFLVKWQHAWARRGPGVDGEGG